MKTIQIISILVLLSGPVTSNAAAEAPGPCLKIAEACKAAGFVKGDWKKGDGLWKDCVDPIIQGTIAVPNSTQPLPIVDAATINACKAKHPKFGSGKVGS